MSSPPPLKQPRLTSADNCADDDDDRQVALPSVAVVTDIGSDNNIGGNGNTEMQCQRIIVQKYHMMRKLGIYFYEYPPESKLHLHDFKDEDRSQLEGNWVIYYEFHRADGGCWQRAVPPRTMTIANDAKTGCLQGKVDKTLKGVYDIGDDVVSWDDVFVFQKELNSNKVKIIPTEETCLDEEVSGTIQLLGERVALRWIPDENVLENNCTTVDDSFLKSIVRKPFDTVAEADEAIQDSVKRVHIQHCWLRNHMNVPDKAAVLIHWFAATLPPCPAIFFEPGDLHLKVIWDSDGPESAADESVYIARRIK